ncbi:MAG: aminotransferase class V-fold PLP-dependent enzyme [Pseudomonadota bacterium]
MPISTESDAAVDNGVYLDWNATAPMRPAAIEAMMAAAERWANPASVHAPGRAASGTLETARETIADVIGVDPRQIIFTGGGTEAATLAMRGVARDRHIVSAVEHAAVRDAVRDREILPVDDDGIVRLGALEAMLTGAPAIVGVMHANNETGVIQPLSDARELIRRAGGLLFADAVQTAGKLDLPEADFVGISAHKLGGPPGVGALIAFDEQNLRAIQPGGGQEGGLRGGTQNLPGIAGFAAAAAALDRDWMPAARTRQRRLEERLIAAGGAIYGAGATRLPNTTLVGMPGVPATTQLMAFDLDGIAVSAGAACSSGKVEASHVLLAMGVDEIAAGEAIRVSTGWSTTDRDVERFASSWETLRRRRRAA